MPGIDDVGVKQFSSMFSGLSNPMEKKGRNSCYDLWYTSREKWHSSDWESLDQLRNNFPRRTDTWARCRRENRRKIFLKWSWDSYKKHISNVYKHRWDGGIQKPDTFDSHPNHQYREEWRTSSRLHFSMPFSLRVPVIQRSPWFSYALPNLSVF